MCFAHTKLHLKGCCRTIKRSGGHLAKGLLCSLYAAGVDGVPVETQYVGHFALHHIKLAVRSMYKFREMPTNTIGPSEVHYTQIFCCNTAEYRNLILAKVRRQLR